MEVWGHDPLRICRRIRVCFDPPKMSHSFIHDCCCITASFTTSMNTWTLSLHWSCLCWQCTMLSSLRLISSKETVSSNQCLCCSTGLKLSWPKTKLQNVGVGDPSLTILIGHDSRCPSHDWSSTTRVAHQGRRSWGDEVLTAWNM